MKAPEVKALVDVLTVKLGDALDRLTRSDAKQEATDRTLSDHRREQEKEFALLKQRADTTEKTVEAVTRHETELVLLKQRVDDMRNSREKWAMRPWGLVGPVVAMLLGYYLGVKK